MKSRHNKRYEAEINKRMLKDNRAKAKLISKYCLKVESTTKNVIEASRIKQIINKLMQKDMEDIAFIISEIDFASP